MPRVTEDTINDLMASYLRTRGLSATTQETSPLPSDITKKPDIWIFDEGSFPGEGEWERSRAEGFVQARDFSELLEARASFLIVYPEALRESVSRHQSTSRSPEDMLRGHRYSVAFLRPGEPTDLRSLPLEGIAEWLRSRIHHQDAPIQEVDEVVRLLRATVEELTRELPAEGEGSLRLFSNLLGGDPTGRETRMAARYASAYVLVDQIAFYRVLSGHDSARFPPIDADKLIDPTDLEDYFRLALKVDYIPVFSINAARAFGSQTARLIRRTVKAINGLNPETISRGTLGKIFHELIPIETRKPVAAYYTLEEAAKLLAALSIGSTDAMVMDPSCGSGGLLAASYQRIKELIEQDGSEFGPEQHAKLVESQLTGIDIMPFAAHLTTIHLALQDPRRTTNKVRVGIHDATVLKPGDKIDPLIQALPRSKRQRRIEDDLEVLQHDMIEAGAVFPAGYRFEPIDLEGVDLVIMNPPFTRHQRLSRFGDDYIDSLERVWAIW